MFQNVLVYGGGQFGFAIARHLGNKFSKDPTQRINLYEIDTAVSDSLKTEHIHPYHFKDIKLPEKVDVYSSLDDALHGSDVVVLAVPSQSVRENCRKLKKLIKKPTVFVNSAKSLEHSTGKRLSVVINEELRGCHYAYDIAVISGGTIAGEMVKDAALGAEISCKNKAVAIELQNLFSNEHLRIYSNLDLKGVEYAGALKNVISIGAGITDGLGFPYGSKTFVISRASKEAKELALKLGAKPHTFSMESQCWGNDMWMSCTGNTRNRYFGELLGKGLKTKEALEKLESEHKIAEGYPTIKVAYDLMKKKNLEAPLFTALYEIVYEGRDVKTATKELMTRELKMLK